MTKSAWTSSSVLGQPTGSEGPLGLLVGHRDVGEVSCWLEPTSGQMPEPGGHGCGEVEHVDGAAPPDGSVDELTAEGIMTPVVGICRHHVGMTEQGEARGRRIGSADLGHERGSSRLGLVQLEIGA